jgi:hypothetical protein
LQCYSTKKPVTIYISNTKGWLTKLLYVSNTQNSQKLDSVKKNKQKP